MNRYRLLLEYDGRPFMGWQQVDHGPSIQAVLETALYKTTGEQVRVHGAGRTDSGVHALAMVAHVDLTRDWPPHKLYGALNAHVRPWPIAVLDCTRTTADFHARFSCTRRRYRYRILNRRTQLTTLAGLVWRVGEPLDVAAMHSAAQLLLGTHDFTTFRNIRCQAASPIKTLDRLDVFPHEGEIHIEAEARSFLHNQVRSMVGCLKLVGSGQWTAADLHAALTARDRTALGFNAPPDGLYFAGADYP